MTGTECVRKCQEAQVKKKNKRKIKSCLANSKAMQFVDRHTIIYNRVLMAQKPLNGKIRPAIVAALALQRQISFQFFT